MDMVESSTIPTRVPNLLEDPSIKSLATVYAVAMLNAQEDSSVEERLAELRDFLAGAFDAQPAFESLLTSPRVSRDDKLGMLERAILPQASPFFGGFLKVLANRERLDLLRAIYAVAISEYESRQGKRRVVVRTAVELPENQLEQIRQKLREILSAEPVLQIEVDPSLIGGLVIQVGDTVYDSSLRNRLGQLQSRLRQRYVHEIQSGRDRFSHSERS